MVTWMCKFRPKDTNSANERLDLNTAPWRNVYSEKDCNGLVI